MLLKYDTLSFLKFPALLTSSTFATTGKCFLGDVLVGIIFILGEVYPCGREVEGILRDPILPTREHNMQILGNTMLGLTVIIDDFILLREGQIMGLGILSGNPAHPSKILFIDNITRRMPPNIQVQGSLDSNRLKEPGRILLVCHVIIPEAILYALVQEMSSFGITSLETRSVRITGDAYRHIDVEDSMAQFSVAVGNLYFVHSDNLRLSYSFV